VNAENLNLEVLQKSRKKLAPGDIFVLKPKGFAFYFGKVIFIDANCGFGLGALLIYIYNATSKTKSDVPRLSKDNLLFPPIFINRLPWSRGYFETVEHCDLNTDDYFAVHSFRKPHDKNLYDERGNMLGKEHPPVGFYGLASYRTIDDRMSKRLGIPLAP
jgi:hypothetical protein